MTIARIISEDLLDRLSASAVAGPRLRLNHNLHPTLEDGVQRLCNAMEPGSYVRPHRHDADRFELFMALRGRFALILMDETGLVLERHLLGDGSVAMVEVPGGIWHAVAALEPGSVFFEVKPGPYRVTSDKDFAGWAPLEGEPGAEAMERWYRTAQPGERPPAL